MAPKAWPYRLLKPSEVQERLGISLKSVYRLILDQELVAYRVGRCWRIKPKDLELYERLFKIIIDSS